uniref:GI12756 n=1 Tax=Solanum tuberosum TaxID=4113 RepID=M1CPH5_SOLTU
MATQRNNPNASKSMADQRNNPNTSKSMADQRNNSNSNSNSNPNPNPNPNNSKSINKKRQPFADISNFNLIPTSTLRKLCSFSSPSTSKSQNVIPKPPISDSNSSKPNYKEANSETSVASSDFNSLQNPNPLLPGKSFTIPSGRGNEAVLYNRRHTTKKSNLEATALPFTSSHENKKDKRKEIDVPCLSLPPPTVMKDKGKAIAEPFSCLSPETRQDKGKRAVVLSTPVSGNKKTKGIHEPFMSSSPQKAKSKAQAISHEHFPSDEKAAEETVGVSSGSCSSLKRTRGKGIVDASVFSCPTLPKKRTNRSEFSGVGDIKPSGSWTDPTGKRKKVCQQSSLFLLISNDKYLSLASLDILLIVVKKDIH